MNLTAIAAAFYSSNNASQPKRITEAKVGEREKVLPPSITKEARIN